MPAESVHVCREWFRRDSRFRRSTVPPLQPSAEPPTDRLWNPGEPATDTITERDQRHPWRFPLRNHDQFIYSVPQFGIVAGMVCVAGLEHESNLKPSRLEPSQEAQDTPAISMRLGKWTDV